MNTNFSKYFVDPGTKRPLQLNIKEVDGTNIRRGWLRSGRTRFPITNGIPRFVSATKDGKQLRTAKTFSVKWKSVPLFGKESASSTYYHNWYLQRYGFNSEAKLKKFLKNKHFILDAGAGLGRDATWYAKLTRGMVFGLDLADSIDLAAANTSKIDNLCFVQGDLVNLPFSRKFFDFIACDQVIHHTKDTRSSLGKLIEHLAPGGHILLYVYRKKSPVREFCDSYLRDNLTSCPDNECWEFSEAVTNIGEQLSRLNAKINIPRDIPLLGIPKGAHDVQRFVYWYFFKCYWNKEFTKDINVAHNYDWYRPLYAHRHTPEEVRTWFRAFGLKIDHFDVCDSGISILGHKPSNKRFK